MAEIYQLPDNGGNGHSGVGNIPFSIPIGGFGNFGGGFGGGFGYGMNGIADLFGLDDGEIRKAVRVLMGINGGMTVSRPDLRMSLVFVGDAASGEEWIDTLAHEVDHVQDAICLYYDVPAGSEDSAWLQGYIFKQIARHINCDCTCEV